MRLTSVIALAALMAAPAIAPAFARDGSIEVCGDLGARANDVAFHCKRALSNGGLSDAQAFAVNLNLGDALKSLGQNSLAVDAFDAAEALAPDRVEPLIGRAEAFEALRRDADARRDWDRALERAPRSVDVRLGRGAYFLRAGAPQDALAEFDAAVALDEDDMDAAFNRGLTHLALGQMEASEADFTRVLNEYPNDAGAYFHRARALDGRDDRRALADFDRAVRLSPEWSDPHYHAGRLLDRLGREDAANARLRRAFELGHKDPWLLKRIQNLGG